MTQEVTLAEAVVKFATRDYAQTLQKVDRVRNATAKGFKSPNGGGLDDMAKRSKQITESLLTPTEQYARKIRELNQLVRTGSINWDIYGRGVRVAYSQLQKSKPPPAPNFFQKAAGGASSVASAAGMGGLGSLLGAASRMAGPIALAVGGLMAMKKAMEFLLSSFQTAIRYSAGWDTITRKLAGRWEQIKYNIGKPLADALLPFAKGLEKGLDLTERLTRSMHIFGGELRLLQAFGELWLRGMEKIVSAMERLGMISKGIAAQMPQNAHYAGMTDFSKSIQGQIRQDPGVAEQKKTNSLLGEIKDLILHNPGKAAQAFFAPGILPP